MFRKHHVHLNFQRWKLSPSNFSMTFKDSIWKEDILNTNVTTNTLFKRLKFVENNRIRGETAHSKAHRSHKYVNNAWSESYNSPPTLLFIPFPVPPHWQTIWDKYFSPSLF
jgi:hypothetical protein